MEDSGNESPLVIRDMRSEIIIKQAITRAVDSAFLSGVVGDFQPHREADKMKGPSPGCILSGDSVGD